jgi:hypothetical protein
MLKSGLIASICALGLVATPVMAAGTAAQSPATSGKSTTMHHKAMHVSTGSGHAARSDRSGGRSSQDNMADQLNGQSLQAAMQGRPFSAGGAGAGGSAQPTPTPRP